MLFNRNDTLTFAEILQNLKANNITLLKNLADLCNAKILLKSKNESSVFAEN